MMVLLLFYINRFDSSLDEFISYSDFAGKTCIIRYVFFFTRELMILNEIAERVLSMHYFKSSLPWWLAKST